VDEVHFIERLKSGDREAFRKLVGEYRDRVFNTAIGLLQNREDTEDVTQDIFIGIFESISQFRGDSKLSTWIYRITIQKSLAFIRNRERKKRTGIVFSLFGRESQIPLTSQASFYHPGVVLENKERAAVLFGAMNKLPENQRIAFTLHKVEFLSYNEISEIMKLTLPAVESLMFRAKQNLRRFLSDYYDKNEK